MIHRTIGLEAGADSWRVGEGMVGPGRERAQTVYPLLPIIHGEAGGEQALKHGVEDVHEPAAVTILREVVSESSGPCKPRQGGDLARPDLMPAQPRVHHERRPA